MGFVHEQLLVLGGPSRRVWGNMAQGVSSAPPRIRDAARPCNAKHHLMWGRDWKRVSARPEKVLRYLFTLCLPRTYTVYMLLLAASNLHHILSKQRIA
jgi:hypothetical protein